MWIMSREKCTNCAGRGWIWQDRCVRCGGDGVVTVRKDELPDVLIALREAMAANPTEPLEQVIATAKCWADLGGHGDYVRDEDELADALRAYASPTPTARLLRALDALDDSKDCDPIRLRDNVIRAARAVAREAVKAAEADRPAPVTPTVDKVDES